MHIHWVLYGKIRGLYGGTMLAVGSTVYVKQEKAFMRTSEATQKKHPNEKSKLMENVNDFLPQYMNRDQNNLCSGFSN